MFDNNFSQPHVPSFEPINNNVWQQNQQFDNNCRISNDNFNNDILRTQNENYQRLTNEENRRFMDVISDRNKDSKCSYNISNDYKYSDHINKDVVKYSNIQKISNSNVLSEETIKKMDFEGRFKPHKRYSTSHAFTRFLIITGIISVLIYRLLV